MTFFEKGVFEDSFTQYIQEDRLHQYLQECGTQVEEASIESLDVQNGAVACWPSVERELQGVTLGGKQSLTCAPGPLEVELSRQMSLLLVPSDGEKLPALNHDEHYVVQLFPIGAKKTVVERAQNILTREEALQHEAACNKAMLEELQRWLNLGAFERVPQTVRHKRDRRTLGPQVETCQRTARHPGLTCSSWL